MNLTTRAPTQELESGYTPISGVHQEILNLNGVPEFEFRVVKATVSQTGLYYFRFEIWDNEGNYRGEYSQGGTSPIRDVFDAKRIIRENYKDRIKTVELSLPKSTEEREEDSSGFVHGDRSTAETWWTPADAP